jgi:hypothetical protein
VSVAAAPGTVGRGDETPEERQRRKDREEWERMQAQSEAAEEERRAMIERAEAEAANLRATRVESYEQDLNAAKGRLKMLEQKEEGIKKSKEQLRQQIEGEVQRLKERIAGFKEHIRKHPNEWSSLEIEVRRKESLLKKLEAEREEEQEAARIKMRALGTVQFLEEELKKARKEDGVQKP